MDSFKSFILCNAAQIKMNLVSHELYMTDRKADHTASEKRKDIKFFQMFVLPHQCHMAARAERLLLSDL